MTRRRLFAARSISSSRQPAKPRDNPRRSGVRKTCSAQNPGGPRKQMQKRHLRSLDLADDPGGLGALAFAVSWLLRGVRAVLGFVGQAPGQSTETELSLSSTLRGRVT